MKFIAIVLLLLFGTFCTSATAADPAAAAGPDFDAMSAPDLKAYYSNGAFVNFTKAVEALLKRGEKDEIHANLRDPHPNRNHYLTAYSIAVLQPEEFTEDMVKLLRDQDPGVRFYAVYFLLGRKNGTQTEQVGKLLSDASSVVRGIAVTYLGEFKVVKFKPRIAALLKDPDPQVRTNAEETLAKLK